MKDTIKQEMRLQVQSEKWLPYKSKYGGEMYEKGDTVICFHSNLHINKTIEGSEFNQCLDCGDSSLTLEEFAKCFTTYEKGWFRPVNLK